MTCEWLMTVLPVIDEDINLKTDEAITQFRGTLRLKLDYGIVCNHLGNALLVRGDRRPAPSAPPRGRRTGCGPSPTTGSSAKSAAGPTANNPEKKWPDSARKNGLFYVGLVPPLRGGERNPGRKWTAGRQSSLSEPPSQDTVESCLMNTEPIAVTGVSLLLPGSAGAASFWRDVLAGKDLIRHAASCGLDYPWFVKR
jgi:hypothetical protein